MMTDKKQNSMQKTQTIIINQPYSAIVEYIEPFGYGKCKEEYDRILKEYFDKVGMDGLREEWLTEEQIKIKNKRDELAKKLLDLKKEGHYYITVKHSNTEHKMTMEYDQGLDFEILLKKGELPIVFEYNPKEE